jgi:hypothetical protein
MLRIAYGMSLVWVNDGRRWRSERFQGMSEFQGLRRRLRSPDSWSVRASLWELTLLDYSSLLCARQSTLDGAAILFRIAA